MKKFVVALKDFINILNIDGNFITNTFYANGRAAAIMKRLQEKYRLLRKVKQPSL